MAEAKEQVVHESEVQRQYIRVPITSRVEINGENYSVKDLSSGGIGVAGVNEMYKKGDTLRMTLILPFPEFSLDMHLESQIQSYSKKDQILGARFINLSPSQISIVNHIIRSYISGDVVDAGEVLDVAQRSDFVRVREQKKQDDQGGSSVSLVGSILPLLLIAMIGLFAFYIIVTNVYDDLFIVSSSAGVVKSESIVFRSPVAGVYDEVMSEGVFSVDRGSEIASIIVPVAGTERNLSYSLASPCDCFITKRLAYAGEYLPEGSPLFNMMAVDSAPYIEVFVDPDNASKLRINDQARIRIAGTDIEVSAQVSDILFEQSTFSNMGGSEGFMVKLILQPSEKLPVDFVGRPVSVEFALF